MQHVCGCGSNLILIVFGKQTRIRYSSAASLLTFTQERLRSIESSGQALDPEPY